MFYVTNGNLKKMEQIRNTTEELWLDLWNDPDFRSFAEDIAEENRPLCDFLLPKGSLHGQTDEEENGKTSVKFLNLKKCYEKIQTRRDGVSTQRPMDCTVHILAMFDPAWESHNFEVFVQRHPESARICGDSNGMVQLRAVHEKKQGDMEYYVVDLDSVYATCNKTPVYKLSTVDPIRRNRFLLTVRLSCANQQKYFTSPPFQVKSRRSRRNILRKLKSQWRHGEQIKGNTNGRISVNNISQGNKLFESVCT